MPDFKLDRLQAAQWAYELTKRDDWCILDTETTGLDNIDQICQVAAIASDGSTLIDTLVRPTIGISDEAANIHGITNERVMGERDFSEIFIELWRVTGKREVVIYNSGFDTRLICQSLAAHGFRLAINGNDRIVAGGGWKPITKPPITLWVYQWINGKSIHCAMNWFSQWCGDWSEYHGNYRWQRLPGGDHSALGDCIATLNVIKRMAASYEELKAEPDEPPIENSGAKLVEMPTIVATAAKTETGYDELPF